MTKSLMSSVLDEKTLWEQESLQLPMRMTSSRWVLGQQVGLRASLMDPEAELLEHEKALEKGTAFGKTLRLREVASAAFFGTNIETRLRRAALWSRARPSRGPFELGQLVHSFRKRG